MEGWWALGGHNKEASKWASSREGGGGGEEVGGFLLSRFVKREKGRRHNCPCRQYTRCAFKCVVKGVGERVRTTLVPNLVL